MGRNALTTEEYEFLTDNREDMRGVVPASCKAKGYWAGTYTPRGHVIPTPAGWEAIKMFEENG